MIKAWTALICSGLLEIIWSLGLNYSEGFTKLLPSLITFVAMILSFLLFSYSLRIIPMGTAYAVWVGLGVVGVSVVGMIFLNESMNMMRIGSILLILIGIIGVKFSA